MYRWWGHKNAVAVIPSLLGVIHCPGITFQGRGGRNGWFLSPIPTRFPLFEGLNFGETYVAAKTKSGATIALSMLSRMSYSDLKEYSLGI